MKREEEIRIAQELLSCGALSKEACDAIKADFPELAESEYEEMRKHIIGIVRDNAEHKNIPCDAEIAWLEKQKEPFNDEQAKREFKKGHYAGRLEGYRERYKAGQESTCFHYDFALTQQDTCQQKFNEQKQAFEDLVNQFKLNAVASSNTEDLKAEQKEQNDEDKEDSDFIIYHPLKNGKGEYECIPYSFYGSLTSFSEDKDLIDFLRTCFYTEEECNEWIEQQKEQKPVKLNDDAEVGLDRALQIVKAAKGNLYGYQSDDGIYECDNAIQTLERILKNGIEQQPAEWSEEDKMNLNGCICSLHQYGYLTYADFLKHLPERFNLQPKQEWSEEDEDTLEDAITAVDLMLTDSFQDSHPNLFKAFLIAKDFLKSLPERFNLQPKQEWSEEDESCWNLIWDILDGPFTASKEGYKKAAVWFLKNCPKGTKSLRPQPKQERGKEDEYVDLGLSVKWAICNVGAYSPGEYGDYYTFDESKKLDVQVPTIEQWKELQEKCKWKWEGNGHRITGKNGNSIFLPAAGLRGVNDCYNVGSGGDYWSSSLYKDFPSDAWQVYFYSNGVRRCHDSRHYGFSVRPVSE